MQVLSWVIGVLCLAAAAPGQAEGTARQLASECDDLIRLAVKKQYGWAWAAAEQGENLPKGGWMVAFDPMTTPTAGLVLLLAGEELGVEKYKQAAGLVAKGIAAAQQATGRIPNRALFAGVASGKDVAIPLPDRAPTNAALGFLLTYLERSKEPEAVVKGAAHRAAAWVARQQTGTAAWPSAYVSPGNGEVSRLIRLDNSDYRNCTFSLLYAGVVLDDAMLRKSAQKCGEALIRLRMDKARLGKGLWHAVYELSGTPSLKIPQYTDVVDLIACRYAMQTLLGIEGVRDDPAVVEALQTAAGSLGAIRYENGLWQKTYPTQGGEIIPIKRKAGPGGAASAGVEMDLLNYGTMGLPPVLEAIGRIKGAGAASTRPGVRARGEIKMELARAMTGLSERPMAGEWVTEAGRARACLAERVEAWKTLEGAAPEGISERVARVGLLVEKLRLERLAAEP